MTCWDFYAASYDNYFSTCPEVIMQDASCWSPLATSFDTHFTTWHSDHMPGPQYYMEFEPNFIYRNKGKENECPEIEMLDLTAEPFEDDISVVDIEMYDATEHMLSLSLEDKNFTWISADGVMIDRQQFDIDDCMYF